VARVPRRTDNASIEEVLVVSGRALRSSAIALFVGVLMSGCIVAEPPGPVVATPPPAAPPPQIEVAPPPPGPAYVWVPGHWTWRGRGYVWVPGHYVVPAQPGYVWVAPHWAPRPGGWVWVQGHWRAR